MLGGQQNDGLREEEEEEGEEEGDRRAFWLRVLYTGGGPGALPRWLVFELQSPTLCRRGKAIFGPPRKPRVQTLSSQEPLGIHEEVTSSHPPSLYSQQL